MGKVCVSCGDSIEDPKLSEDVEEMCENCESMEEDDRMDTPLDEEEDEDDM